MPQHNYRDQKTKLDVVLGFHLRPKKRASLSVFHCVQQTSLPLNFHGFSCVFLLCHHGKTGITAQCLVWIYIDSEAPNNPHIWAATSYPSKVSPQPTS